mmetsp:Transcript_38013/g.98391  ORF Transcript_38013/g.98391 Transcript_38013/m.98391 type:complete len:154 (+) Transcript_38013:52-513(+)|eukprot:CAMPEP_0195086964 /NCGR_PEP_ID=MMETSP0448-20130528/26944_1 /TAXON_ID=66468 /ORGANISM="Heterocapsa triquestra, Strain CCMP 448" /LENGTH=153 /DNA_ID=CAMNT_0040120491 /DNA_START=52 /DNA_END=513 /DNA_ORIENTATION=-
MEMSVGDVVRAHRLPHEALWISSVPDKMEPAYVHSDSSSDCDTPSQQKAQQEVPLCTVIAPRPEVISVGSIGHPHSCASGCKYNSKPRGCKDGMSCTRCHLCCWDRYEHKRPNIHTRWQQDLRAMPSTQLGPDALLLFGALQAGAGEPHKLSF